VTDGYRYVYGVVASGRRDWRLDAGVDGAPVRTIEVGPLAALVSDLPAPEVRASRRALYSHLRVLESAFAATPIVPLPFGTVIESDEAVRDQLLRRRETELVELLSRIEGLSQFTLTARYDEERVLREIVAADARLLQLREQSRGAGEAAHAARLRLGELVASSLQLVGEQDAHSVVAAIGPVVEHVDVADGRLDRILRAEVLVRRDKAAAFETTVAQLADGAGGRILFELVGPLPPTSFIERLRVAEEPAWA